MSQHFGGPDNLRGGSGRPLNSRPIRKGITILQSSTSSNFAFPLSESEDHFYQVLSLNKAHKILYRIQSFNSTAEAPSTINKAERSPSSFPIAGGSGGPSTRWRRRKARVHGRQGSELGRGSGRRGVRVHQYR